jgi:hypothetical protein
MGKRLAAIGVTAAIAVGGLAVAAVNPFQVAGASNASTTAATTGTAPTPAANVGKGPLGQALKELVADKTITQAQADAIIAKVKSDVQANRKQRKEKRKANRQELLGVVAKALGETPQEVVAGLKDGKSIAAQAEAKGVDRSTVADAITKALTARIDRALADGKISSERAAKMKERLPKVVDRILDADGARLRAGAGRIGHRRGN